MFLNKKHPGLILVRGVFVLDLALARRATLEAQQHVHRHGVDLELFARSVEFVLVSDSIRHLSLQEFVGDRQIDRIVVIGRVVHDPEDD